MQARVVNVHRRNWYVNYMHALQATRAKNLSLEIEKSILEMRCAQCC